MLKILNRYQKMVLERQKAEEEQREMQEAKDKDQDTSKTYDIDEDTSKDEHSKPATDELPVKHESEPDQAVEDEGQAQNEQAENLSSSEKATLPHKHTMDGSERVTNSREKRESRRQRGLEHNDLQNKHVLLSFEGPSALGHEELTVSEEALETAPEPEKSTAQEDNVLQGSSKGEKSPNEEKTLSDIPPSSEIKESGSVPEQPPGSDAEYTAADRTKTQRNNNNQIKGSQSFTCPERPTDLALNVRNTLSATGSFQDPADCWADRKRWQRATKDLDSPTSAIQRYVDDPEKLKYKREKWKGKRQSDAGQNDVLSQSLDGRIRVDKSPQDQLQ